MGKERGRPKKGQLVDMSTPLPPDPVYGLPSPDECEDLTWPIALDPYNEIRARYMLWNDRLIVDFAINHVILADGEWQPVGRIDCYHGTIHRHYFKRGCGEKGGSREEIAVIPTDDSGWEFVDGYYESSLKLMEDQWQESLRRWNGG